MISSYPNIFNLGHPAIAELFSGPVNVEEKVDGSCLSFSMIRGEGLKIRSKNCEVIPGAAGMFTKAVEVLQSLNLTRYAGMVFRGEYLQKPKHNALAYDRVPPNHIIIFDIESSDGWLPWETKVDIANELGFWAVPLLFSGIVESKEQLDGYFDTVSILGGQKIEGMVIKPLHYDLFGRDKKVLMGKYVSEKFREVHAHEWKESNPKQGDIIQRLSDSISTPARFQKAVIHLREKGLIEGDPRDIGKLIQEVQADVQKEEEELIKAQLWNWAWPQLKRMATRTLPTWYKNELGEQQFSTKENMHE